MGGRGHADAGLCRVPLPGLIGAHRRLSVRLEIGGRGMATMAGLTGGLALFAPFVAGLAIDAWGVEVGMRILYVVMGSAYAAGATINLIFIREARQPSAEAVSAANLGQALGRSYTGIPALLRGFPRSLRAVSVVIILCFIANGVAGPLLGGVREDPPWANGFAVGADLAGRVRLAEPDDGSGGVPHRPLWTHAVSHRRLAALRCDSTVSAGWLLWVRAGDPLCHRRGRGLFRPPLWVPY